MTLSRRRRAFALITLSLMVVAVAGVAYLDLGGKFFSSRSLPPISSPSASVWALLERPLTLPRVAAGSACPVTSTRPAEQLDPEFEGLDFRAMGNGPVFPIIYNLNSSGELVVGPGLRIGDWFADKVLWLITPDVEEPMLIRGGRLDLPGELHFAEAAFKVTDRGWNVLELRLSPPYGLSETGGWPTATSGVLIRSAGCFGLQLDMPSSSHVFVFEAVQP